MSKLDELLQGVDVEWKKLWEVTTWDKKFNSVEKHKQPKTNKYKYLLASEIKPLILEKGTIKLLSTNDTNWWTSEELVGNNFHAGEIIAIPWGGNPIVQYYKGKFLTGDNRIAVVNDPEYLSTKFLHYYLTNNINLISSFYRGAGIKHPNMHNVLELDIPIPPIEIQQEIVRVLDELTSLTNQLTTELESERQNRKKQFEFFREQLFTFEEGEFKWVILGDNEYFKISSGGTPSKNKNEYWNKGNIPWLRSESCNNKSIIKAKEFISELGLKNSSAKLLEPNTTLIALVGATIFKTGFLKFNACTNQNIASIKSINSNLVNDEYVFMYITSLYETLKAQMKNYGMLNLTTLRGFKIPIPPLEEQERIVKLLDQFDATHTAIEEEITKEIKLRTQQYEYYREKLLSFPSLRTT